MSDLRKQIRQSAEEAVPESTRLVPDQKPLRATKAERRAKRRAKDARYGKPHPIRMSDETWEALTRGAEQLNVGKHKLAEFCIQATLTLIARGRVEVPVKETEQTRVIELPGPPKSFAPPESD